MYYPHTFKPYDHQDVEQREHWEKPWRALFWEQGIGKMKAGYDWAMTLWQAGLIDTMIVVAPNGVHRDWIDEGFKDPNPDDEFDQPLVPPMWWDQIDREFYDSDKCHSKWHQAKMRGLHGSKKMVVLSMTYDACKTARNKNSGWLGGKLFLEKMLRERRCCLILDESSYIQNPSSKVTMVFNGRGGKGGVAKFAKFKRILEGTPVDEGPFNAYPQMQFLSQDFWREHGFASYQAFKSYFGIFKEKDVGRARPISFCVGYKNVDELHGILAPYSSRLLKKDVLDLVPKIYEKMRFELTPEQWRFYEEIRDKLMIDAQEMGMDVDALITAELPIVNVLRLYQITAGYIPYTEDENGEPVEKVIEFKENPRYETAMAWLDRRPTKTVVWCRFRRDIDLLLGGLGKRAVAYHGGMSGDERAAAKLEWLKGDAQYLLPQIQAMARGHTLNIAPDVLYYTNDSRLRLRRQSEDRTHRGKMDFSVTYQDMIATGTCDEDRVRSLRKKLATAERIMGDNQ